MKLTKAEKIGIIGIPVLIGIYLIYKQFSKGKSSSQPGKYVPPATPKPNPSVNPVTTTPHTSPSLPCGYPLKKGVYNCGLVKQLQWALNHIPSTRYDTTSNLVKYRPLAEDGDFGPKTEAVLIDFWGLQNPDTAGTVDDAGQLSTILSFTETDPVAFQAAENPYVQAPAPAQPTGVYSGDWEHNPLNPNHL